MDFKAKYKTRSYKNWQHVNRNLMICHVLVIQCYNAPQKPVPWNRFYPPGVLSLKVDLILLDNKSVAALCCIHLILQLSNVIQTHSFLKRDAGIILLWNWMWDICWVWFDWNHIVILMTRKEWLNPGLFFNIFTIVPIKHRTQIKTYKHIPI